MNVRRVKSTAIKTEPRGFTQVAGLLPAEVRNALVAASQIKQPMARVCEVNRVIERAKEQFPSMFKE